MCVVPLLQSPLFIRTSVSFRTRPTVRTFQDETNRTLTPKTYPERSVLVQIIIWDTDGGREWDPFSVPKDPEDPTTQGNSPLSLTREITPRLRDVEGLLYEDGI